MAYVDNETWEGFASFHDDGYDENDNKMHKVNVRCLELVNSEL